MINVLLQTTIAPAADDWGIQRFSLLRACLSAARDAEGAAVFNVTARDLIRVGQSDLVLSTLYDSDFDQL